MLGPLQSGSDTGKRESHKTKLPPPLGIEHAAYRIETGGVCWIDCPSSFDASLKKTDTIFFTHHHFLGASNLYPELFTAEARIHQDDSIHEICRPFTFDGTFKENFARDDLIHFAPDGLNNLLISRIRLF